MIYLFIFTFCDNIFTFAFGFRSATPCPIVLFVCLDVVVRMGDHFASMKKHNKPNKKKHRILNVRSMVKVQKERQTKMSNSQPRRDDARTEKCQNVHFDGKDEQQNEQKNTLNLDVTFVSTVSVGSDTETRRHTRVTCKNASEKCAINDDDIECDALRQLTSSSNQAQVKNVNFTFILFVVRSSVSFVSIVFVSTTLFLLCSHTTTVSFILFFRFTVSLLLVLFYLTSLRLQLVY